MHKKKRIALAAVILILILLIVWGTQFKGSADTRIYSGMIESAEIPIQPEQGGKIVEISVQEGQIVKAGDTIAKLDDSQAQISLNSAKSQLAQAQFKLNDLLGGARTEEIRRLQDVVAQAQATAEGLAKNQQYEENNLADTQKLYAGGAISKQAVDAQQNKLDTVKAQSDAAQANIRAAQAGLDQALAGYTQPTIQAQKAAVDVASQAVKSAELALTRLTVKSPINAQVLYRHADPGQIVNPGTTLATIIDPSDLWVKVYVPEAKLGQVKTGGTTSIAVDAYPDQKFKGTVLYISDKAEFTPKNVQTKEERTTTVFTVKIGITEGKDLLKAGMPADVTLQ